MERNRMVWLPGIFFILIGTYPAKALTFECSNLGLGTAAGLTAEEDTFSDAHPKTLYFNQDTVKNYKKPVYTAGKLEEELLQGPGILPKSWILLGEKINGDLAIKIHISKAGEWLNSQVEKSPDPSLGKACMAALDRLDRNVWAPALVNGQPVESEHLLIFRYRLNQNPEEQYLARVSKEIRNGNAKKAVKIISRELKTYPYSKEAYFLRAQLYERLGKSEKASGDYERYHSLDQKIIQVIDIQLQKFVLN